MIDLPTYKNLIEIATMIVRGSQVDPLDVVHDVILRESGLTTKDLKSSFFSILRANKAFYQYQDYSIKKRPYKGKVKICIHCKDTLPASAFSYKDGKGKYLTICDPCMRKYNRAYYHRNREKCLQQRKNYYLKNQEQEIQRTKDWYKENKPATVARVKKWRADNPEKVKLYESRRGPEPESTKIKRRVATLAWRKNNRDHVKAYMKAWRERNKSNKN